MKLISDIMGFDQRDPLTDGISQKLRSSIPSYQELSDPLCKM